jgi:hypothetical protein
VPPLLQFPLDPNGLELPSEATLDFDTKDATRTALPYLHALCRCSLDSPVRHGRAILTRVELLSAVGGNYGWLNTSFIVGEGEIDEETDEWWIQAYVCINEVVAHPPAIGDMPPERFRQAGS